jgi:hypothetical protein
MRADTGVAAANYNSAESAICTQACTPRQRLPAAPIRRSGVTAVRDRATLSGWRWSAPGAHIPPIWPAEWPHSIKGLALQI